LQKAQIRIGFTQFSLYVVASDIQLASGRRVMQVTFVDETYQLEKYEVVPVGKGCGFNVFPLGTPVDNRTQQQKLATALNKEAQQISDFTLFPDLEYDFDSFLAVLRQKFNVSIGASYNTTLKAPIWGTFRQVLDGWCQMMNLSWFFESGVLKIFNPSTLFITLPTQPPDALEYNSSEDVRDTHGKTFYNWFQQEGGSYQLNQTSNDNGNILVSVVTLYPIGYEYGLDQTSLDLNQVAAAQYGQEFWILYNYYKGTLSKCGWTTNIGGAANTINTSASTLGGNVVAVDEALSQQLFDAYEQYGSETAGRWYLSNNVSDLAIYENYNWFDESQGQIFSFENVDDKAIKLDFLYPTTSSLGVIPGTSINQAYQGVNYFGNRLAYKDDYKRTLSLTLTEEQKKTVSNLYDSFVIKGSEAANYSGLPANNYMMYSNIDVSSIVSLFKEIDDTVSKQFKPRFTSFPTKGVKSADYISQKNSQKEPDGVNIVSSNSGPTVVSNTSVIKTLKEGAYTVYYNKYQKCGSAHSDGNYFGHKFISNQISSDNQIGITFQKLKNNTYRINRDFSVVDNLVQNPYMQTMSQPRSFLTKKVSFTLNYFYQVPSNFLTNGLVGMNVSVGDNGVTSSCSFSNEVLSVPDPANRFSEFEQSIRNSWIRKYTPNVVIS
jgi:hypothetical protein